MRVERRQLPRRARPNKRRSQASIEVRKSRLPVRKTEQQEAASSPSPNPCSLNKGFCNTIPLKADMVAVEIEVCFVPKADIALPLIHIKGKRVNKRWDDHRAFCT